jgi:hypothetical protein
VLEHSGLVAGGFNGSTLDAEQIFVRLPDYPGPCPFFLIRCTTGTPTFDRDDNLCLLPTGCAVPGTCATVVPGCDPGYQLVSWAAQPDACAAYACDPAFVSQRGRGLSLRAVAAVERGKVSVRPARDADVGGGG